MIKEEAIEILSDIRAEYNIFGTENEATRYHALSWAIQAMKAKPTKHGHWVKRGDNSWECSVCHEISCCNGNYCVDCGARMDGEESDK